MKRELRNYVWRAIFPICLLIAAAPHYDAQTRYLRGQDIAPTFDGWERNSDGTFSMYFGYLNRNSAESLVVPVGPENNFDLGGGDQGQPTYFHPNRRWWVFKVVVPADWPADKKLVWTLTTRGKTSQAKGWLQPEWEVDKSLIAGYAPQDPFLTGVSGGNPDDEEANKAPVLQGPATQSVTLPQTLTLRLTAKDDGLPRPVPDASKRRQQGVRVRWILYRGPAPVRFEPEITPAAIHGKPVAAETRVMFKEPGDYRLRAIAMDGRAFSTFDVNVEVN
jgi:hypothetical protein